MLLLIGSINAAVQSSGTQTFQDIGGVNYTTMTFSSNGTFNISGDDLNVSVLLIAGGAGGKAGGGGAGGFIFNNSYVINGNFVVGVGDGGAGSLRNYDALAGNGTASSFVALTAVGGGAGTGNDNTIQKHGAAGGSGGGANHGDGTFDGGAGIAGQGNKGGTGTDWANPYCSGGGGGAGAIGSNCTGGTSGAGGDGLSSTIFNGTALWYSGGGGGSNYLASGTLGAGGKGGGASGGTDVGGNATANQGGGGGGAANAKLGGSGGSGIVIIRFLTPSADSCTCAGAGSNWEIDMSDYCNITDACDLTTGTLSFINAGITRCDARIDTTNLGDPGATGLLSILDDCRIWVS